MVAIETDNFPGHYTVAMPNMVATLIAEATVPKVVRCTILAYA